MPPGPIVPIAPRPGPSGSNRIVPPARGLPLNRTSPFKHATVYAKLEWYNPFGAVKDRVAFNLIRDAEERGTLGGTKNLVEPTSGNTGMGLAITRGLLAAEGGRVWGENVDGGARFSIVVPAASRLARADDEE